MPHIEIDPVTRRTRGLIENVSLSEEEIALLQSDPAACRVFCAQQQDKFVGYWLLVPATYMQMLMTVSLSLHDRLVLLQYAHFSGLFTWMCRDKSAASDRFTSSWLSQHFQSEESVEKFLTWTIGEEWR
jgi:hypothetical protein